MILFIWDDDILKKNMKRKNDLSAFSLAGIGIGGIIGAGFFLGSGLAIKQAGPSVSIAFLLGGVIMAQVLGAMTSISMNQPVKGSFRVYAEKYLGPYMGFLLGWIVYFSGILAISSEAVAGGIFLRYWFHSIPLAVFSLLILSVIALANAFGTRLIGLLESAMSIVKIIVLITFIIFGGAFLFMHGVSVSPNPYTSISAFFPKGFSGFLESMLIVIFTYSGISALAMAATEVKRPCRDIPRATIIMTIGIVFLYITSMAIIVAIISWKSVSTDISPFVQAFGKMGINAASVLMNLVILTATVSVMIASFYSCVQLLVSLSEAGKAPVIFKLKTSRGFYRNTWLVVAFCSLAIVALSFILGSKLFNYLVSASSYFTFFNWFINIIVFLSWEKGMNRSTEAVSPLISGRLGAYGVLLAIAVLFVMSLRITDFRIGFYVAASAVVVISILYNFLVRHLSNSGRL